MKKFLVVGVGGSGGATLRFAMDQLQADLRAMGIAELPPAWQFVHIDVPPEPEKGPGQLRSVRELGGTYISVSSIGNSFPLVASQLLQSTASKQELRSLLGWLPDRGAAANAPVVDGAGQYRAIGRALFLSDLKDVLAGLESTWNKLQQPTAWGDLPGRLPGATFGTDSLVNPVVVGSMAGGSGASMFLDVCRLLGRLNGLSRSRLGAFLFTADVFKALAPSLRTGVDGNALGALAEIIAAQTRVGDAYDEELFTALGLPPDVSREAAFARLIPIGSAIGGDGAQFGDGTSMGVARGLGRALAATIISEKASEDFVKTKIENPASEAGNRSSFGWGTSIRDIAWGSFGYASLSLGRDRYAEYSAQRVAKVAFDRLLRGHMDSSNQLPSNEQLQIQLDAQWPSILARTGFPAPGVDVRRWFAEQACPRELCEAEARAVVAQVTDVLMREAPAHANDWVSGVRQRLPHFQPDAQSKVRDAAYLWASGWTLRLEQTAREEFLLAASQVGLPYARRMVQRLREHLQAVTDGLRDAAGVGVGEPLMLEPTVADRAAGLKKTMVDANHALGDLVLKAFQISAANSMRRESARLGADVLASYAEHVLGGLDRAASSALLTLEHAERTTLTEAGLAQLSTTVYGEWPSDGEVVPARFDHADNEVLLTTSAEFPGRFAADAVASVPAAGGLYDRARDTIVSEVLLGRWETTGGGSLPPPVVSNRAGWRPSVLPVDGVTKAPTQPSTPAYDLALSPGALLDRARQHLGRRGQPFERFSQQSIEDYLTEAGVPEALLRERSRVFAARFGETMKLARPLVGANPQMVQAVHQTSLRYEFSFSDVPLSSESQVVQSIRQMITADSDLDTTTLDNFTRSLKGSSSQERRIAVFGAYPRYSPLVFSSLLEQIQQRWASSPDMALPELWAWKRARPLPAAMAMGEAEQRAMVAGWLLGRLLGLVDVPTGTGAGAVQVWSPAPRPSGTWLEFPRRLLTSPTLFRGPDDWLPAVLESQVLALVQCNKDTELRALAPYKALRSLYDDNPDTPLGEAQTLAAVTLLEGWLRTGDWPSGQPSTVLTDPALAAAGPAERAAAAVRWIDDVQDYFGRRYLTESAGFGPGGRRRARVTTAEEVVGAPMFLQVAEIAYSVLDDLRTQLQKALAGSQSTGGEHGRPRL